MNTGFLAEIQDIHGAEAGVNINKKNNLIGCFIML
jgi:hypothetical protein